MKLHGSFPSHYPFTLTAEDYRRYPRDFAAFVNLVQQALMEHAFVLLGFSGSDPNFLSWTGWIRDNLGTSAEPVYLCGVLDLTPPDRKALESRQVVPIDLGPLFPDARWRSLRHEKAHTWLLETFRQARPPDPKDWARSVLEEPPEDHLADLPPIPPRPNPYPKTGPRYGSAQQRAFQRGEEALRKELRQLEQEWRSVRQADPGWVVAPRANRKALWESTRTDGSGDAVIEGLSLLDPPDDLFLLFELVWRLERMLSPLSREDVRVATATLERYRPLPEGVSVDTAEDGAGGEGMVWKTAEQTEHEGQSAPITPTTHPDLDWGRLREAWIVIAFALLRDAREWVDVERFERWASLLDPLVGHDPQAKNRLTYERGLLALARLEEKGLREVMPSEAEREASDPVAALQWAALLTEQGEREAAGRTARRVLERIQYAQHVCPGHVPLLSQEGWAGLVLDLLSGAASSSSARPRVERRDRRRELAAHECDPTQELQELQKILKQEPEMLPEEAQLVRGFDPRLVRRRYSWSLPKEDRGFYPGYEYVRAMEEGGLFMRSGIYRVQSETSSAAARIRMENPFYALSILLRAGDEQAAAAFLSRERVAALDQETSSRLFAWLSNALKQYAEVLADEKKGPERTLYQGRTRALFQVLGRLSIRLSYEERDRLLGLLFRLAQLSRFQRSRDHDVFATLLKRALISAGRDLALKHLRACLTFPIPQEDFPGRAEWPEPAESLPPLDLHTAQGNRLDAGIIDRLIGVVARGERLARERALLRLGYLRENGFFEASDVDSAAQVQRLARAIWERTDPESGLPEHHFLNPAYFLQLPEPEEGRAEASVRAYLLRHSVPKLLADSDGDETKVAAEAGEWAALHAPAWRMATQPQFEEGSGRYVVWQPHEMEALLENLTAFWRAKRAEGGEQGDGSASDIRRFVEALSDEGSKVVFLLRHVVLPHLEPKTKPVRTARRLLEAMAATGRPVAAAFVHLERLGGCTALEASGQVRRSLDEGAALPLDPSHALALEPYVRDAAEAVVDWVLQQQDDPLPDVLSGLLTELVTAAAARRRPGLAFFLRSLARLVRQHPDRLTDAQRGRLLDALALLLKETALEGRAEPLRDPLSFPPGTNLPGERAAAAALARAMKDLHAGASEGGPEIIQRWEEAACKDPLPEVREAWRSSSGCSPSTSASA